MADDDFDTVPASTTAGTSLRFFVCAVVIIALTAGATATAGLLRVQSFVDDLKTGGTIQNIGHVVTRAEAGSPQTLLLIGSDHRFGADRGDARSDTMMLVRLDPDAPATTVLSIPRDLRVEFTDQSGVLHSGVKINETYTDGGEALTARVIKRLLNVEINHIVNLNFGGFREAIEAIGCVYVDIDRRYYHSNLGVVEQYAEINLMPGYDKLCGQRALDYVRYRHGDNDFVRGARQQDFLRQLRSQYDAHDFVSDPHKLTRVIGRRMQTDKELHSVKGLLGLAELVAFSAMKPIQQIPMPQTISTGTNGASFVEATPEQLAQVRHAFLNPQTPPKPAARRRPRGTVRGPERRAAASGPAGLGLRDAGNQGKDLAIQLGPLQFPVYYPRYLTTSGAYMQPVSERGYPRRYRIKTPEGTMKGAYRFVVEYTPGANYGNYYGIQGTAWKNPPILGHPSSDRRTINGKKLDLYYDGKRLRLVAWRTPNASYWISNTLEEKLSNDQMLAIAGSLTRLGAGG